MLSKRIGTWAARRPTPSATAIPSLEAAGREFPAYRPTHAFRGPFLDADHRALAALPVRDGLICGPVPGFLRPADALALYEHARLAGGDVLEMGSAWGLSTTILGRAVRNAGRGARVASIEIDPAFQDASARAMDAQGLRPQYEALPGDAVEVAKGLIAEGRTFGFAFIDHDHALEPSRVACRQLPLLLKPGGYALFHDFNDARNRTEPDLYGVHRAVGEMAGRAEVAFLGVIGCCALVRRSP